MSDERKDIRQNDDHAADKRPGSPARARRPYAAPALEEYGTVAKLTQTGSGSINDFFGRMRMMVCL